MGHFYLVCDHGKIRKLHTVLAIEIFIVLYSPAPLIECIVNEGQNINTFSLERSMRIHQPAEVLHNNVGKRLTQTDPGLGDN